VKALQPSRRTIRVLVAESTPISSQVLSEAVDRHPDLEVLGYSSDPAEISALATSLSPDVLLISAQLGEDPESGLNLVEPLRSQRPKLRVIVLLNARRPELIVRAFRSGASGVFCRSTLNMLCKCITAVSQGQFWADSEELGYVMAALAESPRPHLLEGNILSLLSKREREVVGYLVQGLTNREIAETLGISQHTVKNYLFKIFEKVGMSNRVELVFNLLSKGARPREENGTMPRRHQNLDEPMVQKKASSARFPSASASSGGPSGVNVPTTSPLAETG
jgi:two-component system, NarL family, nitrate/nitrite response regulator NarL